MLEDDLMDWKKVCLSVRALAFQPIFMKIGIYVYMIHAKNLLDSGSNLFNQVKGNFL